MIRVSNADYLARPLRLSPTEATAMIVALRAMRDGATDETREIVDRVLAKLEAAAAEGPAAARIDPGVDAREPGLVALADRLREAAERHLQVRLTYYVPSRDEQSERVVDPRGIVTAHGLTYLDAWCHSAEAPRLFRIDRIADGRGHRLGRSRRPSRPRATSRRASSPSPTTPRWSPCGWPRPPAGSSSTTPWRRCAGTADGTLEVDLLVADERWLLRLLLRLAPHARVLSPPEYAEEFTRVTRRRRSPVLRPRRTV